MWLKTQEEELVNLSRANTIYIKTVGSDKWRLFAEFWASPGGDMGANLWEGDHAQCAFALSQIAEALRAMLPFLDINEVMQPLMSTEPSIGERGW